MSTLPKLDIAKYKHELFGLGKKIEYRPFTVKEQKILLLAKEADSAEDKVQAIKQIISLCTFEKVDPDKLPFFDIEDLFLRIRARSVSNTSEIYFKVKDSKKKIKVTINLDDVKLDVPEGHSKKIMLTDSVGIMMKYPSLEMISTGIKDNDTLLKNCIDYVFTNDEMFYFKDFTDSEVEEWIDSFDIPALSKIKAFFDTMPRLRHEVKVPIGDDEFEILKFEGLEDFFS